MELDGATIFAGALALIILIDISVLWIRGQHVPELLSYLATSVFGWYFGRDKGVRAPGPAQEPPPRPPAPLRAVGGALAGQPHPAAGRVPPSAVT